MTFTPPRRNSNLPPFNQLEQRNRAIQQNAGIQTNSILTTNELPNRSHEPVANIWGSLGLLGPEPLRNFYFKPFEPRINYREELRRKNLTARPGELNSNYLYFKKQGTRSYSIEYILLEAIALGKKLKTKTTCYDPASRQVSLMGSPIVSIKDKFRINTVSFPESIKNHANLFRHRLRQLGLSCLSVKGHNRLYLTKDYYVFLDPGKKIEIPPSYEKICLPKGWYNKAIVELPTQLDLNLEENWVWKDLMAFNEVTNYGTYRFYLAVKNNQIFLQGVLDSRDYGLELFSNKQALHIKTKEDVLPKVIGKIKKELEQTYIDKKNKIETEKLSSLKWYSSTPTASGIGFTNTSTTTWTWTTT